MSILKLKQFMIVISSPVLVIIMGLLFYTPVSIYLCNNSGIVYYYATDGKDVENIFINTEIEKKTGVLTSINNALINNNALLEAYDDYDTNTIAAYKILKKNRKIIETELYKNEEYIKYLASKEANLEDLFSFLDKMIYFDQSILNCFFLVAWLMLIYIMAVKYNLRKQFYLISFIGYIIFLFSDVTKGFTSYCFYKYIYRYTRESLSNYLFTIPTLCKAFINSSAAFIILDVIIENSNKKIRLLTQFQMDLDKIIDELEIWITNNDRSAKSRNEIKIKIKDNFKESNKEILNYIDKKMNKHFTIIKKKNHCKEEKLLIDLKNQIKEFENYKTNEIRTYVVKLKLLRLKIKYILR